MAKCKGFKVTEVQIEHAPRRYGTSRYRLLRHRGLIDIVSLMAVNTSLRPFHLFCEAAAACWFLALMALAGWAGIALYAPADSMWTRIVEPLAGLLGTGAFFLGMILPLLGFQFEVTASRIQDAPWRDGLIKEKMEARVGPIVKRTESDDEDGSPAPFSRAEVEARRVSRMKEATAA